ncbi:hypothetical protein MTCD1_01532 [Colwellia marinimaniae]|uniref:Uncharacterized protein n=1 Tax=Colwellia marinimaniae TaxID=1513592 RepID=A0ABQ0MU81_9GAMM|nr:hypothetical protein MTCD1_01532 [Colwellia marinimaniae]
MLFRLLLVTFHVLRVPLSRISSWAFFFDENLELE